MLKWSKKTHNQIEWIPGSSTVSLPPSWGGWGCLKEVIHDERAPLAEDIPPARALPVLKQNINFVES